MHASKYVYIYILTYVYLHACRSMEKGVERSYLRLHKMIMVLIIILINKVKIMLIVKLMKKRQQNILILEWIYYLP